MKLIMFLSCVYLGKTTIEMFIAHHKNRCDLSDDKRKWRVINTKIMNEKRKLSRKTTAHWNALKE
jgi:hypothetical protein